MEASNGAGTSNPLHSHPQVLFLDGGIMSQTMARCRRRNSGSTLALGTHAHRRGIADQGIVLVHGRHHRHLRDGVIEHVRVVRTCLPVGIVLAAPGHVQRVADDDSVEGLVIITN